MSDCQLRAVLLLMMCAMLVPALVARLWFDWKQRHWKRDEFRRVIHMLGGRLKS